MKQIKTNGRLNPIGFILCQGGGAIPTIIYHDFRDGGSSQPYTRLLSLNLRKQVGESPALFDHLLEPFPQTKGITGLTFFQPEAP